MKTHRLIDEGQPYELHLFEGSDHGMLVFEESGGEGAIVRHPVGGND
jgi:hypothetical protein